MIVQSVVIKFLSKVYSKSLLKVWSLKGLVVYSLMLDYQFCTCVMRISSVPQLQVIYMERLYSYKWHIMYDQWFTIALLTSGFGQVWAKLGLQKSRTTLGEIVQLNNCAVADKGSIDEYYRELGKAGITKIAYNFRRDCTTAQFCSCRQRIN